MISKIQKYDFAIVWFFVLLSIVLKLVYISTFSVQHDEPFSIFTANLNWSDFWQTFQTENNPPLHLLLLKLIISIFGMSVFWMRLLSVLCASFSIYFLYQAVKKISSLQAAIIASFCMIFSNLQTTYSHQIRAYALLVLLASISFYFLVKTVKKEGKYCYLVFGIMNVLMMYTHFMGIIYVGILGGSILYFWNDNEIRKSLFWSFVVTAVLFLPYLPVFYQRYLWVQQDAWQKAPESMISIYFVYWKFFNQPLTTIVSLIIILLGFMLNLWRKAESKFFFFLYFQVLITFFGIYFIAFKVPVFYEYYLIFIAPALYALVGVSVYCLSKSLDLKRLSIVLFSLMPLLFLFTYKIDSDLNFSLDKEWGIVHKSKEEKIIVFSPAWRDLDYCFATKPSYYFVDSKEEFEKRKHADLLFEDYFFTAWWYLNDLKGKQIFILDDDFSETPEFDALLQNKFILVKQHTEKLAEYKWNGENL